MKQILTVCILLLAAISFDAAAKKKMYKWVDENGKVTYSDQMPPDQIKKEHQKLNDHGVVVDEVANARTAEEIEAEKQRKIQQKKDQKLAKEQEIIRQNILKAYTNEEEILRLKEERMYALKRNIESAQENLEFQKTSREQLMSIAADSERRGQKVSDAIKSRIESVDEKINHQLKYIETKKEEIERVESKFDTDLEIYRKAKQAN